MLNVLKSFLLVAFITVLLAEVSLRIFHAVSPSYLFESRSYLSRWRGEPGEWAMGIRLNSGGFKDPEFEARNPETYRIVALGDSFAYGVVPYENNYLTVLEERLGGLGSFEVLNMGIPGLGPDNYRALFVEEGLALEPDMVLLSFFIGNDLTDGLAEEGLDELLGEEQYRDMAARLFGSSYLGKSLHYLFVILPRIQEIETLQAATKTSDEAVVYCDTCPSADWGTFLMIETYTAGQFFTDIASTEENVDRTMSSIQQIKEICDDRGIELVVVLIPDTLQVNEELHDVVIAREHEEHREYWDHLYPNRLIQSRLDNMSVPYLDLYDAISAGVQHEPMYIPRNTHWNIRGNEVAADAILDFLSRRIPAQ